MSSCRATIPLGGPITPAKTWGLRGMPRQGNLVDQLSFHDPSLSSIFSSEKQFQSSYAYIRARSNLAQLLKNKEQAITINHNQRQSRKGTNTVWKTCSPEVSVSFTASFLLPSQPAGWT